MINAVPLNSFAATPFFATMAQRGQLDYPLFGLDLGQNSSGSLAFGKHVFGDDLPHSQPCIALRGG